MKAEKLVVYWREILLAEFVFKKIAVDRRTREVVKKSREKKMNKEIAR